MLKPLNAVPSPISGVTHTSTSNTITLSIELNDIRGDCCNLEDLWVQCTLLESNALSQSIPYQIGMNDVEFIDLKPAMSYNYQVKITIMDRDVILPIFSGTAATSTSEYNTTC